MNILDKIIATKRNEVAKRIQLYPLELLQQSIYYKTPVVSLSKYLKREDRFGIIAEFKRQSPSAGVINNSSSVEKTSIGYMQAGASALSILTDKEYFGGSSADLIEARKFNFCPILRKDFIVDAYQVHEAKSIGADAILLIAACLSKTEIKTLSKLANDIGLEVLMEIHEVTELEKISNHVQIVGINNRDLKTFKTNIETSKSLFPKLPSSVVKISESGLNNAEDLAALKTLGFNGFLIGGYFMQEAEPNIVCQQLIKSAWKHYRKTMAV